MLRLKQPTHLTPMDDVLLNKAGIMERCLRRVAEEYAGTPSRLLDPTHQDAIVLNLERAGGWVPRRPPSA